MDKLFKLKEHGTDVRTEVLAGFNNFLCNELYSLCKPSNAFANRNACSGCILGNNYRFCSRNFDDGFLC